MSVGGEYKMMKFSLHVFYSCVWHAGVVAKYINLTYNRYLSTLGIITIHFSLYILNYPFTFYNFNPLCMRE